MGRLPAQPSSILVCLELVTVVGFVEGKCFAVDTKGLLLPWFLSLVHSRRGGLFPPGGVFSLSCWVVHLSPQPATKAFIFSIIPSTLALFVAAIAAICLLCCSCSIAKSIKCGYGASLGGTCCYINNPTLRLFSHTCLHISCTRLHTTSVDNQTRWHKKHKQQTNTTTMVEPLTPPAAWI